MKHLFKAIFPLRLNKTVRRAHARTARVLGILDELTHTVAEQTSHLLVAQEHIRTLRRACLIQAEDYAKLKQQHVDLQKEAADLRAHLLDSTDLSPITP